ncbi:hypothetical protein INT47_009508 [Mucor saturninus]|uniref:Uncharacterized protein n=1 Tax=Mucor saturninus TaxID=64648 RepID=A0A8H7R8K9_9FUNG|nr:hypothetical protein INT47_009508 [Mucor saturninus]
MPAPTLLKSKWNTFITKLSPTHEHAPQPRRRRSSAEDHSNNNIKNQKRRKHSDAVSVGTYESNVSIADKFRQVIPFFRRSTCSNMSSEENLPTTATTTTTTAAAPVTVCTATCDYYKQLDELKSLYTLAVDEINYAEDSQGSSYYSGDLVTAREALDDCANAFMQLLAQINDLLTREGLQSSMAPKLLRLQKRLDALPDIEDC